MPDFSHRAKQGESLLEARSLTMQDRLLVVAHAEAIVMDHPHYRVIADTIRECVRCCDYFPECAHVLAESERVDREEGRCKECHGLGWYSAAAHAPGCNGLCAEYGCPVQEQHQCDACGGTGDITEVVGG